MHIFKQGQKKLLISFGVLLLGICLGTFSKYLDYRQTDLPAVLSFIDRVLDLHNFLGGFSPWILIALCLSIYSQTPLQASINVFLFFVGMVSSYYLYSNFVAGFFPRSYAMIWIILAFLSPFLAWICWHAKGKGTVSQILSAGIISVFINTAFAYGMFYLSITSFLNVAMLLLAIWVLHRSAKETLLMIASGILLAVLTNALIPFRIW